MSNTGYVAVVFATALTAFIAYAAAIQFGHFDIPTSNEHLRRAQGYIAAPTRIETVIVGSSLTYMVPPSVLGPRIANLGMPGDGPSTGLSIIERSDIHPKLVMIEANLISREENEHLVNDLFHAPECQFRKYITAFRAGYDPLAVLVHVIRHLFHRPETIVIPTQEVTKKLIESQRESLLTKPDMNYLHTASLHLADQVARLQAAGIRVGFFRMPIEPSLDRLPQEAGRLQIAEYLFPPGKFCWMQIAVPGGAHTFDGAHLIPTDASLVGKQLAQASNICGKNSKNGRQFSPAAKSSDKL